MEFAFIFLFAEAPNMCLKILNVYNFKKNVYHVPSRVTKPMLRA